MFGEIELERFRIVFLIDFAETITGVAFERFWLHSLSDRFAAEFAETTTGVVFERLWWRSIMDRFSDRFVVQFDPPQGSFFTKKGIESEKASKSYETGILESVRI